MDEWLFVPEGQADRSQARSAWESVQFGSGLDIPIASELR
jgi:hypothetical protein